ncbi:MAG: cupin-like domain-containing protein, partial [Myxococcota bacterium]
MGGLRRIRPIPWPSATGLHDEWRSWVLRALLSGNSVETIIAALVRDGVPEWLARREVDVLRSAAKPLGTARRSAQQYALVARLLRTVSGADTDRARADDIRLAIERRAHITAADFYTHYWAASRPLLLAGMAQTWPDLERWSPARLGQRFAEARVRVTTGRDSDPDYDANTEAHTQTMALADFVARIASEEQSNDFYMVARNRNLERPPLSALLAECGDLPPFLDPNRLPGCVSLWLGPAGTRTPLHHDTCNILFCQLCGRKQVWLISPLDLAVLDDMSGVYAGWDAAAPPPHLADRVAIYRVIVEPGDALFIPVGWWHQVASLSPS